MMKINSIASQPDRVGRHLKKGWLGIVDETKEEYAYPPELFEKVE